MRSPCSLCLRISPLPLTFECLNQSLQTWFVYLGTWAHHNGVLHKSLPSVCVSVCMALLPLLGKGSVKCVPSFISRQHVPAQRIHATIEEIFGRVCLWVCLCIPLSLLGNNSVKTFPRRRRIGGIVFCAVHVVSKESRRLVISRTSGYLMWNVF
jgi:hypothetical protein